MLSSGDEAEGQHLCLNTANVLIKIDCKGLERECELNVVGRDETARSSDVESVSRKDQEISDQRWVLRHCRISAESKLCGHGKLLRRWGKDRSKCQPVQLCMGEEYETIPGQTASRMCASC